MNDKLDCFYLYRTLLVFNSSGLVHVLGCPGDWPESEALSVFT